MRLIFGLIFCLCAFAMMSCRQSSTTTHVPATTPSNTAPSLDFSTLDDILNAEQKLSPQPAYAIGIVYRGHVVYQRFHGKIKGKFDGGPINDESIFRIGSVSKGFAGVLAAMLAEKKLININDPVSKYIPELRLKSSVPGDSLRIWHILSHSTGLTEHAFSNLIEMGTPKAKVIAALSTLKARDITGQDYAYQNAAYSLIEEVIAKVTGMTYKQALQAFIFQRLGMSHASADFDSIANNPHFVWPQHAGGAVRELDTCYYNTPSAGGINASLADMEKWLIAIMGFKPEHLSHAALKMAFEPRISTSYDDKYFNFWPGVTDSHYGLGWRILDFGEQRLIFHGGQVSHYRAEIAFDPQTKLGIVAMFSEPCRLSNVIVPTVFSNVKTL